MNATLRGLLTSKVNELEKKQEESGQRGVDINSSLEDSENGTK